ncbi:MAG: hypothetical protein V4808_05780 [Pseudomonadota bacterium]
MALATSAPAPASDWYYVDADSKGTNITFIDKSSIRTNSAGNTEAAMFSVLAADDQGTSAYRFIVEFQCEAAKSRLMTGEMFDPALKSDGPADMGADWEGTAAGSQGDTILQFVCTKGASRPDSNSLGDALPLAKGRAMLAERVAKGIK